MTGALARGGVSVRRPILKPPAKAVYSDSEYRDMLEMIYVRFMERAGPIERKQKAHLFYDGANQETLETIKTASCYEELRTLVLKHDLANPSLKGAELFRQAKEVLL